MATQRVSQKNYSEATRFDGTLSADQRGREFHTTDHGRDGVRQLRVAGCRLAVEGDKTLPIGVVSAVPSTGLPSPLEGWFDWDLLI